MNKSNILCKWNLHLLRNDMSAIVYVVMIRLNKCITIDIQKFINDIKCICSIVNTDPDCYQLVFVNGVIHTTTTMKYNETSTTTDESDHR